MPKKLLLIILCLFLPINFVFAAPRDELSEIKNILNLPEEQIDVAVAKLTIDKIIDPSIDINLYLKKIDELVNKIKIFAGNKPANIIEINTFLYEKGAWNNNQVYGYNSDDPLGKNLRTNLLSTYLDTKKGNCVSMPVLYYLIARKLGLGVYFSNAPEHIFIQAIMKDGRVINIDPTHKGYKVTDDYYIDLFSISQKALANKLYLQPLTSKEIVSVLLIQLIPFYLQKNELEKALYICDLALKYYPKSVSAIVNKSAIYSKMYNNELAQINKNEKTVSQQEYLDWLELEAKKYLKIAKNLGWREEPKEEKEVYLQNVKLEQEKTKNE